MNSLKTLSFPGTAVASPRLYPLFLFFHNLHFLAPVEADPAANAGESVDSFMNWGFCQVHTPRPLGADHRRFLRLVADITSRGPEYVEQLSSLTLAALPDREPEETERGIVTSLLPSATSAHDQEKEKTDPLWQARLLLAIGEVLDREEEEIALSLARFEDEEKKLFQELQGEDDGEELEALLGGLARLDVARRGNSWSSVKQRCQAWKTLFAALEDIDFPMLLARTREAGDLLREEYQLRTGQEAKILFTLPLPTVIGWSDEEARTALERFVDGNAALLATMTAHLSSLLDLDPTLASQAAPLAAEVREAWESALDHEFPEERRGRVALSFSFLPGWPIAALLDHPEKQRAAFRNGLLAVLG